MEERPAYAPVQFDAPKLLESDRVVFHDLRQPPNMLACGSEHVDLVAMRLDMALQIARPCRHCWRDGLDVRRTRRTQRS